MKINKKLIKMIFIIVGVGYLIAPDFIPGWVDDLSFIATEAVIYYLLTKKIKA